MLDSSLSTMQGWHTSHLEVNRTAHSMHCWRNHSGCRWP